MTERAAFEAAWAGDRAALRSLGPELQSALAGTEPALAHGSLDLARLAVAVRNAWLRFDGAALRELAPRLAAPDAGWSALAFAGAEALAGRAVDVAVETDFAAPVARALQLAQRSVALLSIDALDEAASAARQSVRDAREARHDDAHRISLLALARVRRAGGRPHLARRILAGLSQAPRAYASWTDVERFLSGDHVAELRSQLDAAAGNALVSRARDFADLARELRALSDAVTGACTGEAAPFVTGQLHTLRHRLEVTFATEPILAAVFVDVRGSASRRLAPGAMPTALGAGGAGRTEEAIAALALSGPEGVETAPLFRAIYGFPFRPQLHDGTFRVLLTRVRQALAGVATLERSGERLRLRAERPFVVVDPRVRAPLESPVLQALVDGTGASAKELSTRLAMPLRSVQAELARLVEEGICVRQRAGREASYEIEDTTFRSEPVRAQ